MPTLKPFKGYRANPELASQVACRPYDVLSSDEAREEAKGNPYSFLHVIKSEIDLPEGIDIHTQQVYDKAIENLQKFIADRTLIQDAKPCYYVYAQTMFGKTQYGIVGGASIEDYANNLIKKHELTRPDKEEDRMIHIRETNFNAEPVFFAFADNKELDLIIEDVTLLDPNFDFVAVDGISHHLWVIDNEAKVERIEYLFKNEIPCLYVADGHHRTAAAARVGAEKRAQNPNHTGNEEYNFFLSVNFPASQLRIIDYNRLLKDLNGLSVADFVEKLKTGFDVELKGADEYKPKSLHNFAMYLEGNWYSLTAKAGTYDDKDPIGVLDVTILTKQVLDPIVNIGNLRTSTRIDFVGGIRGLGELKKRVDTGEMKCAFALFPVSMDQLMNIADTGNIMPPKTTWFEPKLRSGLVLHELV